MGQPAELAGVAVIVTRPAERAGSLCRALAERGATVVACPAMEILPAARPAEARRRLARLRAGDWAVFVSPAAVAHGVALFPGGRLPETLGLAAVGEATAAALRARGAASVLTGRGGHDSESLLARPELARLAGRRVALLKAPGGRRLLARVLRERGAEVVPVPVYRRARPAPPRDGLAGRVPGSGTVVSTVTSGELLDNFTGMLAPAVLARLRDMPLVTVSERVARLARRAGFNRVSVAGGADTVAMVRGVVCAVSELRSDVTG